MIRTTPRDSDASNLSWTILVLAVILATAAAGLVVSAKPAYADHGNCSKTSCRGEWPSDEDCTPGSNRASRYFIDGYASIKVKHSTHCSLVFWARLQWDGVGYPAPPSKFNFKIERYGRYYTPTNAYWGLVDRQTRTVREAWGGYSTRMIPNLYDPDGERTRACARRAIYIGGDGDGYGSYGSWQCTSWFLS